MRRSGSRVSRLLPSMRRGGARIILRLLPSMRRGGARIILRLLPSMRRGGARILRLLLSMRRGGARIILRLLPSMRRGGARILRLLPSMRRDGARIILRPLLTALLGLSLIAGASMFMVQRYLDAPLELPAAGIDYQLRPGASLGSMTEELAQKGILRNPLPLRLWARLAGLERKMIAGEYHLQAGTSRRELLEQLRTGRVKEYAAALIEGWTFRRMMAYLHSLPALEKTLPGVEETEILQQLGINGHTSAEGLFFPDTYNFRRGVSDLDIMRRAHRRLNEVLELEWKYRDAGLPLDSPYEALTLASIIEKETAVPAERGRIAGVFVRRLQRGMRLEADPTVIYGLGENFRGSLRQRHLRDRDNPYNSYRRHGLPPTPIALPGLASIQAALHPEDGDSLYFVARGDGSHVFSASLSQHLRAVADYRRLQRRDSANAENHP